jgi:hypothetical protein
MQLLKGAGKRRHDGAYVSKDCRGELKVQGLDMMERVRFKLRMTSEVATLVAGGSDRD